MFTHVNSVREPTPEASAEHAVHAAKVLLGCKGVPSLQVCKCLQQRLHECKVHHDAGKGTKCEPGAQLQC